MAVRFDIKCFRRCMQLSLIVMLGCVEPYAPSVIENPTDILVVHGFMNATNGTASVKISKAQAVYDTEAPIAEEGATVSIESSAGSGFNLTEQSPGNYVVNGITIDKNVLYTLRVTTSNGNELESDVIQVKSTPPIDSISTEIANDGESLNVLVSTHDPSGETRYYSWDFLETYEYNAPYFSGLVFDDNKVPVSRTDETRIDKCWRSQAANTISIANSAGLDEDIIHLFPLINIHKTSQKISVRYSILVSQRSISEAEYTYLDQLKKSTESIGGLFDPIPASVAGNIHYVNNAGVPVVGYFSGSEVTELRYFIERFELPEHLAVPASKGNCELETTCDLNPPPTAGPSPCAKVEELSTTYVLIGTIFDLIGNPVAYTFTPLKCGDCRTQGGTTTKPDFW